MRGERDVVPSNTGHVSWKSLQFTDAVTRGAGHVSLVTS